MPKGVKSKLPTKADPEFLQRVIQARFEANNITEIAKQLNVSRDAVAKVLRHPDSQSVMLGELRYRVSQLYKLAVEALEKQLLEGNMEAIKTVFKTAGALEPEVEKSADNQLVVVLNGVNVPKTEKVIEVVNEEN